jgi:membrane glycosyltransferase
MFPLWLKAGFYLLPTLYPIRRSIVDPKYFSYARALFPIWQFKNTP